MKYKRIRIRALSLSTLLLMALLFSSCYRCSCHCEFCMGCSTLTVKTHSKDSIVAKKTFCSAANFYTDNALVDSISAFTKKYPGYPIAQADSTWNCDRKTGLTCKQSEKYKGYLCHCAK